MTCIARATQDDFKDLAMMELAAKAAGLSVMAPHMPHDNIGILNILPSGVAWSPLHDDGDALRLAHHLEISLDTSKHYGIADLRRAIVRAAAAIGESM